MQLLNHGRGMPRIEVVDFEPALKACASMEGPLRVKAVLKEPALTALEHTLNQAFTSSPELFRNKKRARGGCTRHLTRHIATVGDPDENMTHTQGTTLLARVPMLAPLLVSLVGDHQLVRMQVNCYPVEEDPHAGHRLHSDGLQTNELTLIVNMCASIIQTWKHPNGTRTQMHLDRGDAVCFGRLTDQRWEHGIEYGAAHGEFRVSIVLTLRIS